MEILIKAKKLQPMVGTYAAAKMLRARGVPLRVALVILAKHKAILDDFLTARGE